LTLTRINNKSTSLLENFLANAGSSLATFRYFSSRTFDVLNNHLVTYILEENGKALAYGHLDKENDIVWLGTCVIESQKGKGLGKKIMRALIAFAEMNCIPTVRLSVDNINSAAQALYIQSGFQKTEQRETFSFFEWKNTNLPFILVSSLAFMGMPAEKIIQAAEENDFALEFSSGMAFRPDMEKVFLEASLKKYAHNYFPAPEKPFVLNLGSANEETRKRSVAHCISGLRLSWKAGAPFFSAHAGFCIDPKPEELGQKLSRSANIDRDLHWKIFCNSVKEILSATADLPTRFLIENNVLAKMNVYENGFNPLFCADPDEMNRLMLEIGHPRLGLLLDTAHIKVSARTLNFDAAAAVRSIQHHVSCIHHSDNTGELDNNEIIGSNYWFLPLMSNFRLIPQVIEVKKIPVQEIKKEISLLKSA
jgi:sugar phosphate isomerase/epimerase/GNAT superfamily N-acetyltransferase